MLDRTVGTSLTDADLHATFDSYDERRLDDYSYVRHYLTAAQEFAVRMARDDKGIVYLIG